MNNETAIIIFNMQKRNKSVDLEIPLNITASELIIALNTAYKLGIDTSDIKKCYLKMEQPLALLKGNKTLSDFGMRNGSIVNCAE